MFPEVQDLGTNETTSIVPCGDGTFETHINDEVFLGNVGIIQWEVTGSATAGYPAPVCNGAAASEPTLWPPNHKLVAEQIVGVTASAPGPISSTITAIQQDEPTLGDGSGNTCPDGQGIGAATAEVRSERDGSADGRVYHIGFTATDSVGGTCMGTVTVCVPLDPSQPQCGDEGPKYDSTKCP
jgi:hypothetical protein